MKILFKQYLAIKAIYYTIKAINIGGNEKITLLKISMEAINETFCCLN